MRFSLFALGIFICATPAARAQQVIKPRVMVMVDTSGSMLWRFANNQGCGGDGSTSYRDGMGGPLAWYPGAAGTSSRMFAAKKALTDVVNGAGNLDFGLMRYAVDLGCPDTVRNCCTFANPRCRNGSNLNGTLYTNGSVTWTGGCGPTANGIATDGGQVLVQPSEMNASKNVMRWIDGVEDFRDRGDGWPNDGELRAQGPTPLAGSARTALSKWYTPIYDVSKQGSPGFNANSLLYDAQLDCRSYVLVLMTDGADTCDNDATNGPPNAVSAVTAKNPANPVKTYVIGLSIANQGEIAVLNTMAQRGGSNAARFANSAIEIAAAFADITADAVKVEYCNNKDDNCNAVVDEGYDKGAQCAVGVGPCRKTGIKKCDPMVNTQTTCCVDDGNPNGPCVPLTPGAPQQEICNLRDDDCNGLVDDGIMCVPGDCRTETCNGKDDDCNGKIDDMPIDVGLPCGLDLGICMKGSTVCVNGMGLDVAGGAAPDAMDKLECRFGVKPRPEQCNGLDDDCDGVVDGIQRTCYSGPQGTEGIGPCRGGLQRCTAAPGSGIEAWSQCVGELVPMQEICDGLDNDCNGAVDDVPGGGIPCCPSGRCGVGVCTVGVMACGGGGLVCIGGVNPRPEECNGLDDDCNGRVDDLPLVGKPCRPQGGCGGEFTCDVQQRQIVCTPLGMGGREVCNGVDDNCNGFVDEEPDVSMNDPAIGQPCGNPNNDPLPCLSGKTVCRNGQAICLGAVSPSLEVCNCKDDNCNTVVDDNAFCPGGTECVSCGCYGKCGGGEFPCPGGYSCYDVKKNGDCDRPGVDPDCYCLPLQPCDPICAPNEECKPQPLPATKGICVDRCLNIKCPDTYACRFGVCVDVSCVADKNKCKPCANGSGERCDLLKRECVPDLCCGKDCGPNALCQPLTGACRGICDVTCPPGQRCIDGACAADRCAGKVCNAGFVCDPTSGECVRSICPNTRCLPGQACCANACTQDPCSLVTCPPGGFRCRLDVISCGVTCEMLPAEAQDRVVGAGGGGFACAVDGAGSLGARRGAVDPAWALVFLALALRFTRRARKKIRSVRSV